MNTMIRSMCMPLYTRLCFLLMLTLFIAMSSVNEDLAPAKEGVSGVIPSLHHSRPVELAGHSIKDPPISSDKHVCKMNFRRYISSVLEKGWVSSIGVIKQTDMLCRRVREEMPIYKKSWLPPTNPFELDRNNNCTSYHIFDRTCTNQNGMHTNEALAIPIEPLVALLRHPSVFCISEDVADVLRKDWLILPPPNFAGPENVWRRVLVDLGASLYSSGAGGASQKWFWEEYANRNMKFDRIFAWEAVVHPPKDIFNGLPEGLLHRLSYYNVPIDATVGGQHNPATFLKACCTKDDYVVMKLDIDTGKLESNILQQILGDDEAWPLLDEVFFEHHTEGTPMVQYWGDTVSGDITDSYKLFLDMRTRGIRAHSWV